MEALQELFEVEDMFVLGLHFALKAGHVGLLAGELGFVAGLHVDLCALEVHLSDCARPLPGCPVWRS